eukprot:Phypoly_transcript_11735.p1 GENE.Phypoly_transcript_11735~~Phypoly_transcript_11735.p1  ORF type:complete len:366 (+),score=57.23 Phypoly_transcript_11735:74-1171(+)
MNFSNLISLSRSFIRAPLTRAHASQHLMRAAVLEDIGSTKNLVLSRVPIPSICAGDVLVKVHASSINPLDNQMRFGYARSITGLTIDSPVILGRECSGVVEKVGQNVWNFKEGDEVVVATAPFRQGSHAEYIAVDETEIAPKPTSLSHIESASLPFSALTAWNAINIAKIEPGMKVLVLGGSGRVGFTLVSLLKQHLTCHVTTTTSQQNLQKLLDLGLPKEDVIDHAQVTQLRGGFDAVFDTQGTAQSEAACVAQLRNGGAYVTFNGSLVRQADSRGIAGLMQGIGENTCKRVNMVRDARGIHYGYALFSPSGENLRTLMGMADKGVVKADVDKVFNLEQIAQAYDYCMEASGSGKVVINVSDES